MAILLGATGLIVIWHIWPSLFRLISALRHRARARGRLVLTFDDGPSPDLTGKILSLLAVKRVRATFFMPGERIDLRPDLARRILAEGHEVGSHSYGHHNARLVGSRLAIDDMLAGVARTKALGGTELLFRPPYGKVTTLQVLRGYLAGLRFAYWTVDPRDTGDEWASVEEVTARLSRDGGGIILLHDSRNLRPEEHEAYVFDVVTAAIDLARSKGWQITTYGELWSPERAPRPQRLKVTKPS